MSQEEKILDHLKSGRSITPLEALDLYGCFRLASRISDLKKTHHNIERTMVRNNGKKFASYKMGFKKDFFV
jgi:hypothetical protein